MHDTYLITDADHLADLRARLAAAPGSEIELPGGAVVVVGTLEGRPAVVTTSGGAAHVAILEASA